MHQLTPHSTLEADFTCIGFLPKSPQHYLHLSQLADSYYER